MDEALLRAYLDTDYQVRMPGGRRVSLRIGAPVPAELAALIGPHPWACVTAWNPRSQPQPPGRNRAAQRGLLARLRALPGTRLVLPAAGLGREGWREASLFVTGPAPEALDAIGRDFAQHAYVYGQAGGTALLRRL